MNVRSVLALKGADVVTVSARLSLADAAAILRDRRIGAVVVSEDGQRIDGILSERDIVCALATHGVSALGRSVDTAMTRDVLTCQPDDSVEALMESMTERRFRHLPVIDADGHLAGIISIGDVVKRRLEELKSDNLALIEYVHQGR
jgi:CBS domain-containing protein